LKEYELWDLFTGIGKLFTGDWLLAISNWLTVNG